MRFLNRGEEVRFAAGDVVVRQGLLSDGYMYYLIDGNVRRKLIRDEQVVFVENVEPGHLFGLVSSTLDRKNTLQIEAVDSVRAYRWERQQFENCIGIYQELARLAIQDLTLQLRSINTALADKQRARAH